MNESNENPLRARFQELRDDRPKAPAFQEVLERAQVRGASIPRVRTLVPVWIAAAAAVVLVTGVVLRRSDRSPASEVPSISTWKSPTAGLLRYSGREMFAPPSVLSSSLGRVMSAPAKSKGGSR